MGHYVSFVVQSWKDDADGSMRWSVQPVHNHEPLQLPDGSFVVRTWIDDEQVVRGLIRHVQSGREMQFQSGQSAIEFIRSWTRSSVSRELEWDGEGVAPTDE
jgi:hypothetical protein